MIFFLILGIVLGIVSVIFVSQNTELITVTFFSWQIEGSLALILFLAIVCGATITLLILFPSFVRDAFSLASIKRKKKILEEELLEARRTLNETPPPAQENANKML